jgi:2-dehydro-3-deoxy-D-arabinonate dehydratase
LAAGEVDVGPDHLLPEHLTIEEILGADDPSLLEAIARTGDHVAGEVEILAPIGSQEIWAAGVTYLRSRDARLEESQEPSAYDRVYEAERPELFHKAAGWRAVGPRAPVGIRRDSGWNVPEPELALVLDAHMRVVGYTLGNDMSSRQIEGENTLYLPQAKTFDGACSLGPAIVPVESASPPFTISLIVEREGEHVVEAGTSTDAMARSFEYLTAYLGRALSFPVGAVLLTGTGIVPEPAFTLRPGDVVRISAAGLGSLANPVEWVGSLA